jgi:CDP-paratose 2-epimerase
VLELVDELRRETGVDLQPARAGRRPGDQKVFVSDIEKARDQLALRPSVPPQEGLRRLVAWAESSEDLLRRVVP